jgi:hypothetical protein
MTRRQKIIVAAVLVAIALLFSGAVANGGGKGEGNAKSGRSNGFIDWLGGLFGQPDNVGRNELTSTCLDGSTLTIKGSCVLTVAKSGKDLRQVKLHAKDAVSVTSRTPRGNDTATSDVKAGDDIKVSVDGKGGDITFNCADGSGATCVVTLT